MELGIVFLNFGYGICGAVLALGFMAVGYKLFDRITPFNTAQELDTGNIAIGIVVGSIFISTGLAVGLVVGLSLN
ncbi:MAG: hypothetical protein BA861_00840 [Desulfobacterales bacterium S3730MH5]|nr:MAG: hypothetical protein BA861_00840 [Desulfobacterales bacterium S3730MH5]OEU77805.1 MAG: hypothetical protein BA865_12380 [Desulfobacterales bacterium S5133MH4]